MRIGARPHVVATEYNNGFKAVRDAVLDALAC